MHADMLHVRMRVLAIDKHGSSYIQYENAPQLYCYNDAGEFIYLVNFDLRILQLVYLHPNYHHFVSVPARIMPAPVPEGPQVPRIATPPPQLQWHRLEDDVLPITVKPARAVPPPRQTTTGFGYKRIHAAPAEFAIEMPPVARSKRSGKKRRARAKASAPAQPSPSISKFDAALAEVAARYPPASPQRIYTLHKFNRITHTPSDRARVMARYHLDLDARAAPIRQKSTIRQGSPARRPYEAESPSPHASALDFLAAQFVPTSPCTMHTSTVVMAQGRNVNFMPKYDNIPQGLRDVVAADTAVNLRCYPYQLNAVSVMYIHDPRMRQYVFRIIIDLVMENKYQFACSMTGSTPTYWATPGCIIGEYQATTLILCNAGAYRAVIFWGAAFQTTAPQCTRDAIIVISQSLLIDMQRYLSMFNHAAAHIMLPDKSMLPPSRYYEKHVNRAKSPQENLFALETGMMKLFSKMPVPTLADAQLTLAKVASDMVEQLMTTQRMGPTCRKVVLATFREYEEKFVTNYNSVSAPHIHTTPDVLRQLYHLHAQQLDVVSTIVMMLHVAKTSDQVGDLVRQIRDALVMPSIEDMRWAAEYK